MVALIIVLLIGAFAFYLLAPDFSYRVDISWGSIFGILLTLWILVIFPILVLVALY